ncbi:uncharacterized protein JCM6883_004282 [Sporobolomyces salmoneus]|uniref:uncharacterized protein n=1 Tax=Sporobolomyces salmoneus TaxID=183962 RepID=UPI0031740732
MSRCGGGRGSSGELAPSFPVVILRFVFVKVGIEEGIDVGFENAFVFGNVLARTGRAQSRRLGLPLILSLSQPLSSSEYSQLVIPPLLRMFQVPDRAMRMALLEGLEKYSDKLTNKEVVEKVWPHFVTGFGDLVPVIREVTVKSVLLIAPKLSDRILNNDLLRYLSKTQTDSEPGIRTNTCILLSRLSPHLSSSTRSKVLIPAFARSLRDPFVHARIEGLMSLMAGTEGWEKEDLAGKVIPSVGICLVDKEKAVRDQGFKAIDMFVRKCEQLTASMPETALPPPSASTNDSSPSTPSLGGVPSVGLATNAAGAAGVLAGWAFGGSAKKLSTAELAAPIERRVSTPSLPTATSSDPNVATLPQSQDGTLPGGFAFEPQVAATTKEDWGGDLMDVNDDTEDWDEFESGQPKPPTKIDPLAARLSSKPKPAGKRIGGSMRLGTASKSSALRVPMDMDATDSWDLDLDGESSSPAAAVKGIKPKPTPASSLSLSVASSPSTTNSPVASRTIPVKQPQPRASTSQQRPPPPPAIVVPRIDDLNTDLRSPLPPLATPPLAPVAPSTSTVPPPPLVPPTPTEPRIPVSPSIPAPVPRTESIESSSRPATPASPALSTSTTTTNGGGGGGGSPATATLTKEEKAAKMAAAREERRKRMAAAKAGNK